MTAPSGTAADARSVAAIIPCKDEGERIVATVEAVLGLEHVDRVVVVDDGSTDDTAAAAHAAGADVIVHAQNFGKAAALTTGVRHLRELESGEGGVGAAGEAGGAVGAGGTGAGGAAAGPRHLLFVDGDLEGSASNLGVLIPPVLEGRADMTIAILPPQRTPGGGRGFVVRLARDGIEDLTGWTATQPLSGMRCLTAEAFEAASPLAPGWGVEVGLTTDVLAAGMRVVEVPCDLQHRVSGSDWRGQLHRAEQYRDVWRALTWRRTRKALTELAPGVARRL
ncbi:glycosyl transferase family 2 [Knoellia remsis]|uniref:Glucosyl-3-phosphoglycerate synthase n=1 Tax=Knoellia remsis TaxID=407159 RepID=A0A2T0UCK9_9MICO|nr:glycosyltransferase [Knoellia remsis]PRY55624.1 glycosyl transferase family 2 [Knoellia remsis]